MFLILDQDDSKMTEIRPFRGVRYNQQKISDLASVICPPYDVITPQLQEELYQTSEYNFVRIEYNRELPQDNPEDNRYTRAAANISEWLQKDILKWEAEPTFYIHQHHFTCLGRQYKRDNIIACIKLEEWDKKIVLPHENVMPKPKSDRLNMLWACQSNTSPVLSLFEDPQRTISFLLTAQMINQPLINVVDNFGERHKVWTITQPDAIKQIQQVFSAQPIYIADGHHRYDSALTYRRERMAQAGAFAGEAEGARGYDFVMMNLVDFADPGLVVLPTHRLVRGISRSVLAGLKSQLSLIFELQEIPLNSPDLWTRLDSLLTGVAPDTEIVRLGLFGLDPQNAVVLTLRDFRKTNPLMPSFHGDLYKKLDVSLVDHVVLEKLLGFSKEKEEISLAYNHDRIEAWNRVKNQEFQLLFLVNPVKPELIKAIADEGDRMPRKSTYFYPKTPAGLVFYKW
jgi:uncharacterized protein (DUF1015 family)